MFKFVNYALFSVIFFFTLSRFIFPFSDVPDVSAQSAFLQRAFGSIINYFNFDIVLVFDENVAYNCGIVSSKFSLWSTIEQSRCLMPLKTFIFNILFFFILFIPLVLIQYNRNFFYKISIYYKASYTIKHWNNFLDATLLSLSFSGFIYILGFISLDTIALALSIYVIIFIRNIIIIAPLVFIVFLTDIGSSIILIIFISFYYFYSILSIFLKMVYIFIFLIVTSVLIYILQDYFFNFLLDNEYFEISLPYQFLINSFIDNDPDTLNSFTQAARKYPIFVRPIITYMSAIYLSAAGLKAPLAYIYNFLGISFLIYLTIKYIIHSNFKSNDFLLYKKYYLLPLIAAISTIIFLITLFPNNAYAKYYIFLLPFFFNYSLIFFDRFKILQYIFFNNFLVFYFLILYSI